MNAKLKIILLITLTSVYTLSTAQNLYTKADSVIYSKYITAFAKHKSKPIGELMVLTGKYFIGKPYAAATLENNADEQLVVNLREFDCVTFVESNVALIQELRKGEENSFEGYMDNLQRIRYRDGKISGYISRLHYSTDWIYDNTELFDNITIKLGGAIVNKPINFMSSNIDLYPALKSSKVNQEKIKTLEQMINKKSNYALLPISKVRYAIKDIKTGDIIVFGTKVHGLDYSHMGIAFWEGGVLKLLHASSVRKKVVVDAKTLLQYCTSSSSCTGITILRLTDRR